jgi:hypothetical protein
MLTTSKVGTSRYLARYLARVHVHAYTHTLSIHAVLPDDDADLPNTG